MRWRQNRRKLSVASPTLRLVANQFLYENFGLLTGDHHTTDYLICKMLNIFWTAVGISPSSPHQRHPHATTHPRAPVGSPLGA